jgi:hypothetical protein
MFKEVLQESNSEIAIAFQPESREALENQVINQFRKDGYKLIAEQGDNVTVERGSFTGRVLLGAFYKYFKWDVKFIQENDRVVVTIHQKTSGMWGGVIGVNQVRTELKRLRGVMSNWN